MKEFIVTKDILNIRNSPSDKIDNNFVGQLLRGDIIWLEDADIIGDIPKGGTSNIWKSVSSTNVVASEGVKELSWEAKKEILIQDLKKFWDKSKGANTSVAILDTGIKKDHPNLPMNIEHIIIEGVTGKMRSHGTQMAGFFVGRRPGLIVGFSPDIKLFDYRIFSFDRIGTPRFLVKALQLISESAEIDILNLSLEFKESDILDIKNEIDELISKCIKRGKIVVTCTGNTPGVVSYPGSNDDVITVGVIKNNDVPNFLDEVDSKNFNRNPDCFIEMDNWPICDVDNDNSLFIEVYSDIASSDVTAVLSSLIALKKSVNKTLTQAQIRALIKSSSSLFMRKGIDIFKLNISNFLNS